MKVAQLKKAGKKSGKKKGNRKEAGTETIQVRRKESDNGQNEYPASKADIQIVGSSSRMDSEMYQTLPAFPNTYGGSINNYNQSQGVVRNSLPSGLQMPMYNYSSFDAEELPDLNPRQHNSAEKITGSTDSLPDLNPPGYSSPSYTGSSGGSNISAATSPDLSKMSINNSNPYMPNPGLSKFPNQPPKIEFDDLPDISGASLNIENKVPPSLSTLFLKRIPPPAESISSAAIPQIPANMIIKKIPQVSNPIPYNNPMQPQPNINEDLPDISNLNGSHPANIPIKKIPQKSEIQYFETPKGPPPIINNKPESDLNSYAAFPMTKNKEEQSNPNPAIPNVDSPKKEQPKCLVCNAEKPGILPCNHTFCKKCLLKHITGKSELVLFTKYEESIKIPCILCDYVLNEEDIENGINIKVFTAYNNRRNDRFKKQRDSKIIIETEEKLIKSIENQDEQEFLECGICENILENIYFIQKDCCDKQICVICQSYSKTFDYCLKCSTLLSQEANSKVCEVRKISMLKF